MRVIDDPHDVAVRLRDPHDRIRDPSAVSEPVRHDHSLAVDDSQHSAPR